jgi:Domain of unknown function (DUF222)/HNH endonuclease
MSSLRSALDELRGEDVRSLSDDELAGHLDEIERAGRILEFERCRGLAEVERRKLYAADGHLSAAAWLAHRQGLSRSAAEGRLRRARALETMPSVARAFAEGEVSESAVHVLASAREAAPDAFARSEEALAEAARTMAFGELRRVTETWRAAADPDRALEDEERRHERRRLDICPTAEGMTGVHAELDAEDGQALITAIRAEMDAETRSVAGPDLRTPTQRRADALGEICRQWLASRDRPNVGGERPNVVVTIDLESLVDRSGRRAEMPDTGSITPETARRLACDADVTRVITRAGSEPLELGRRTKVVPPGLRKAIAVRDRGCRFPGCGRPPGWCDAHHVVHWADGGETSLSNLVLLCRPHHRTIHRGFGVEMVDGRPVFSRPDGTTIEDRAPPQT